jgi:uncharacterized protein
VASLAAVRATREAIVERGRERLPSIIGAPLKGESIAGETFDGTSETAVFPGDLPDDPGALFDASAACLRNPATGSAAQADLRFLRFRPPALPQTSSASPNLPHIRLDRALQFLLGDRLK